MLRLSSNLRRLKFSHDNIILQENNIVYRLTNQNNHNYKLEKYWHGVLKQNNVNVPILYNLKNAIFKHETYNCLILEFINGYHPSIVSHTDFKVILEQLKILHQIPIDKHDVCYPSGVSLNRVTNDKNLDFVNNQLIFDIYDLIHDVDLESDSTLSYCHGDLFANNIIIYNNICYFIDLETMGVNKPEYDLAKLVVGMILYNNEKITKSLLEYVIEHIQKHYLHKNNNSISEKHILNCFIIFFVQNALWRLNYSKHNIKKMDWRKSIKLANQVFTIKKGIYK